jgi:hypothetical protein
MNTTIARSEIAAAELERITSDLNVALDDQALLERLKSAADRVKRLSAEKAKAVTVREKALAEEAKAAEVQRFAGLSDIQVTESINTEREHVLNTNFTISYVRPTWDMYAQEALPRQHTVNGFRMLPHDVLDFLIERHPERIPAKIRCLADDPADAMAIYFAGLRRGYLTA